MCERYQCLPNEGGLLDQDQLLMRKLEMVSSARAKKQQQDQEKRARESKNPKSKGK